MLRKSTLSDVSDGDSKWWTCYRSDTLARTLRDEYGDAFAPEVRSDMELGTLKERLGFDGDDSLKVCPAKMKK